MGTQKPQTRASEASRMLPMRKQRLGAGKMAQVHIQAPVTPAKDCSSVPSTCIRQLIAAYDFSTILWPLQPHPGKPTGSHSSSCTSGSDIARTSLGHICVLPAPKHFLLLALSLQSQLFGTPPRPAEFQVHPSSQGLPFPMAAAISQAARERQWVKAD